MIYIVTNSTDYVYPEFEYITVKESLKLLSKKKSLQCDTETTSLDPHLGKLLLLQLGTEEDDQFVIDVTTVDIKAYKEILENTLLIFHNAVFDLQWLYNYEIIPRKIYDTMIAEQTLYLGYSVENGKHFGLKDVANQYLGITLSKAEQTSFVNFKKVFSKEQLLYAAKDVTLLHQICYLQMKEAKVKTCTEAIKLECQFIPACAYLNWCGIKLDEAKWTEKMQKEKQAYEKACKDLDDWMRKKANSDPAFSKYVSKQLSLFDEDPEVLVDWGSSKQVIPLVQDLGFNTKTKDKKTKKLKDSVQEDLLAPQKGICDEFLDLYFEYQSTKKVVTTYGETFINNINPYTGRIYSNYKAIGAISSRMSCGGGTNETLAQLKGIPAKKVPLLALQTLPHDELTRSCFIAEDGNLFCSCDYAAKLIFPLI